MHVVVGAQRACAALRRARAAARPPPKPQHERQLAPRSAARAASRARRGEQWAAPDVRRGPVCGAGGAGAPRHVAEARLRAGARPKCPQQARRDPPAARAAPGRGVAPFWPARSDLAPRRAARQRVGKVGLWGGRGRPGCRDKMTSPTCRTGEGHITAPTGRGGEPARRRHKLRPAPARSRARGMRQFRLSRKPIRTQQPPAMHLIVPRGEHGASHVRGCAAMRAVAWSCRSQHQRAKQGAEPSATEQLAPLHASAKHLWRVMPALAMS